MIFDSTKAMGWDVEASDFNLVNSNEEVIAAEPFTAMLVIVVVAILSLILASRGIANRQF